MGVKGLSQISCSKLKGIHHCLQVEDAKSLANSKEEKLHLLSSSSSDAEEVILKLRNQV